MEAHEGIVNETGCRKWHEILNVEETFVGRS
jgi:hypothetical protein